MRKLLASIIILMAGLQLYAVNGDSVPVKIMIIPFNPDYYFSDADDQLAEYNNKKQPDIRAAFRQGLNLELHSRVHSSSNISTYNMLVSNDELTKEDDLYQIYRGLGYQMQKPLNPFLETDNPENGKSGLSQNINELFSKIFKKKKADETVIGLGDAGNGDEYMNTVIHNPEMLEYLSSKYGTSHYVFINQVEIKTNYEQCLDRSLDNFNRTVKVHFSIFNAQAEQLYGNAITIHTTTTEQDLDKIIEENFVPVADYITGRLTQLEGKEPVME